MKQTAPTAATAPTEIPPAPDFAVKITVFPTKLVLDRTDNFVVRNYYELHMVWPLMPGDSMTLLLTLSDEFPATIQELSFGRTAEEAMDGQRVLNTHGLFYGDSPFLISPGLDGGSAQVTVVNEPGRYRGERWFFDIWPSSSSIRPIDPQIYNKAPDGGGAPGFGPPRKA